MENSHKDHRQFARKKLSGATEPTRKAEDSKPRKLRSANLQTCKDRFRGFVPDERKCQGCRDIDECIRKTLERLSGVATDIAENLLHDSETVKKINRNYGQALKENARDGYFDDSAIDSLRESIHESITDFRYNVDEDDLDDVKDDIRQLHPVTIAYLSKMAPAWRERFGQDIQNCIGPHQGLCKDCACLEGCRDKWLNWGVRIPLFITRAAMRDLTPPEFMILVCIASHANWNPNDAHFGMCWLTYKEISQETGIQQPGRQIKELEKKGFIQLEQIRRTKAGEFTTTNCFTVNWFKQLQNLGVDAYAKDEKKSKK